MRQITMISTHKTSGAILGIRDVPGKGGRGGAHENERAAIIVAARRGATARFGAVYLGSAVAGWPEVEASTSSSIL